MMMAALAHDGDAMQLLRLHLYTEFYLHACLRTFFRTDEAGVSRLGLGYFQKVQLVELLELIPQEWCDHLRKVNAVRNKVAHQLDYKISIEDKAALIAGLQAVAPKLKPTDEFALKALVGFYTGFLAAAVELAALAADRLHGEANDGEDRG